MAFDSQTNTQSLNDTITRVTEPALDEVGVLIMKARDLLSDPARWYKGDFVCEDTGAVCVLGALGFREGYPDLHQDARPATWAELAAIRIEEALPLQFRRHEQPIPHFNDDDTTTHADILALLDRAAKQEVV